MRLPLRVRTCVCLSAETFSGMDPKWYAPQIPGLLNAMTTAQAMFGVPAPAFGSRPYFAGGDPSLMDAIECTNCPADQSVDTWDTYLDVVCAVM